MHNTKTHLQWCFIIIFSCFGANGVLADESTPYAQYGIGTLNENDYVPSSSMGGLGAAYRSPDGFNFNNPASLSTVMLTSFEAGGYGKFGKRKTDFGSAKIGSAGLQYLSMSFPVIKNRWGMAAGLIPYTTKDSYSSDSVDVNGHKGLIQNENNGNLYNFFWSNGVSYKEYSLGLNVGYLFGNLSNNNIAYALKQDFPDLAGYGSWYNSTLIVKSFTFNLGAQYHKAFHYGKDNHKQIKLTVGLAGAPGYNLGKRSTMDESVFAIDSKFIGTKSESESWKDFLSDIYTSYPESFDTLSVSKNQSAQIHVPGYIQAGFTLADSARWLVGMDYRYQSWSKYSGYGNHGDIIFQNSWRMGLGGEFLPSLAAGAKFFSKLKYRAGFHYAQTNLQIGNQSINEFGINLGFGIPIVIRLFDEMNTKMYVYAFNLSFEAGSRGTLNGQLIKENYGKIKLGINLNNAWFQKRKYY
ncbi:MAG: outer membrane protein transport protein [Chitinophagales bacterium]|nr:outer membrane protein transport protein [Chitinophagales bacterium]